MPRYEFSEDGSSKFWAIALEGSSFTARWGKIGAAGQQKRQDFATAEEAKKEYEKLIASKLKKGYRCVDEAVEGSDGAPIPKDLSDPAAYLVYADWLQSRNDPRGELITVQHARLTADTPELRKREAQLLEGHADALFGRLAPLLKPDAGLSVTWHLGFLKSVRVGRASYDSALDVGETLGAVLALPVAEHLEAITIGLCEEPDGEGDCQGAIDAVVEAKPRALKSLFLGDFESDQSDISATQVGDLTSLYAAVPGLRSLKLRGAGATLDQIVLPELREFTFESGGLGEDCVSAICKARWPKLERLTVWFGSDNYGSEGDFSMLEPLLRGRGLAQLKHLGLANCEFITGNIEPLAKAKVLAQLESLDLSLGVLGDEDAEAFVRQADAFKHLGQLDVSENFLTQRGLWLLRKVVPGLVSRSQNKSDTREDRYVAVGE